MKDITLGQYALRESMIHRLDPRTKVLSSLFFMLCVFFIHRLDVSIIMMILSLIAFRLAKLNTDLLVKNLRAFWVLFVLTFFVHVLFTPGRILWHVPGVRLYITEEGFHFGVFYSLRLGILISLANLLTLTTSPMDMTDALEKFLKPFRRLGVPSHEIGMMFSISLRFIPILIDEAERIRKAQLSRGARHEGSIVQKVRSIVPLIIPLFLSAFRRAHDLALAMDARCYQGSANRTSYYLLKFRKIDKLAFLTVLLVGLPILVLGNR
jgi:energy-coupling factor transport system permease protein